MCDYPGYVSARGDGVVRYLKVVREVLGETFTCRLAPFFESNMPHLMVSMGDFISLVSNPSDAKMAACHSKLQQYSDCYGLPHDRLLLLDSGGYQLQTGKLIPTQLPALTNCYYNTLYSTRSFLSAGFTIDVAPGRVCPFANMAEAYQLNTRTYTYAARLPMPIRRQIYAIHHFRTPGLHSLFRRLLLEDGLANEFLSFATGGLACTGGLKKCPCVPYALPLIDILEHVAQRGENTVKFHVLGQADHKDHLANLLITEAVRKQHGINLRLTCDSATYFNGCSANGFVPTIDEDEQVLKRLEFKASDRASDDARRKFAAALASILFGPNVNQNEIEQLVGILARDDRPSSYEQFGLLLYMHSQRAATDWSKALVPRLIALHEEGEKEEFVSTASELLGRLNSNGMTSFVKRRAESAYESLSLIVRRDPDEVRHIIQQFDEEQALTH